MLDYQNCQRFNCCRIVRYACR